MEFIVQLSHIIDNMRYGFRVNRIMWISGTHKYMFRTTIFQIVDKTLANISGQREQNRATGFLLDE